MISREEKVINELQLVTGVMTNDISYLCYLLLKDGSYFSSYRSEKEIEEDKIIEELNAKCKELEVKSFDSLLKTL